MEEKKTYTRTVVVTNEARCLKCMDVIQSVHRHDYRSCSCGNLSVDGGNAYLRRTIRDGHGSWVDLSETYYEEVEKNW